MNTELLTADDVAQRLGMSVNQVKRRTAAENWPCVRFSSRTIRYRVEHVEAIIAMHDSTVGRSGAFGQTARSRRRAS